MKRSFTQSMPALLFVGTVWFSTVSSGQAQGLEDLFERPTDARFAIPESRQAVDSFELPSDDAVGAAVPMVQRIPISDRVYTARAQQESQRSTPRITNSRFAESESIDALFTEAPASQPRVNEPGIDQTRPKGAPFSEPAHRLSARDTRPVASPSDLKLVDQGSDSRARQPLEMTAMELRQLRAMEQTRSRLARLEAARWAGSATLRPSWNPSPTTASRFPIHNTVRVPVYVRSR